MSFKIGNEPWNKGITFSEEYRKKLSIAHLGQKAWNKGLHYKSIPCSEEKKNKKRIKRN